MNLHANLTQINTSVLNNAHKHLLQLLRLPIILFYRVNANNIFIEFVVDVPIASWLNLPINL